jgi:tetratricopeptide (TPR) repeat protein
LKRNNALVVIADFSDYISAGFDSYDVRLLRGIALHHVGRHGDAIADLSCAISMCPEKVSAYFRRAQAYDALGDKERAMNDFSVGRELLDRDSGQDSGRGG